jgi:hypothetical protein
MRIEHGNCLSSHRQERRLMRCFQHRCHNHTTDMLAPTLAFQEMTTPFGQRYGGDCATLLLRSYKHPKPPSRTELSCWATLAPSLHTPHCPSYVLSATLIDGPLEKPTPQRSGQSLLPSQADVSWNRLHLGRLKHEGRFHRRPADRTYGRCDISDTSVEVTDEQLLDAGLHTEGIPGLTSSPSSGVRSSPSSSLRNSLSSLA